MFNKIKTVFFAIIISTATLGASAQSASAGSTSFEFRFGGHQSQGPSVRIDRHHRDRRHYKERRARNHYCSPHRAIKKARRKFGVRHAYVTRANHRKIVVKGYKRGHRVKVVFANDRGCPVIHRRAAW